MDQSTKKPWQSKTIILNAVLGAAAALSLFVPGALGVSAWVSAHGAEIAMAWSVLNIVLRAITKDKIQLGD